VPVEEFTSGRLIGDVGLDERGGKRHRP
jgi:hypothetical protein